MAAFSMDLRRRIVEAWKEGQDTQAELAELFGVSLSWLVKLLARWRRNGSLAPRPHGGGNEPCLDPEEEDLVEAWIRRQPDLALSELQARLERQSGTRASLPTLCRVCQRLDLPRKKRRSKPTSGTVRMYALSGRIGGSTSRTWTLSTPGTSMKRGPHGP